MALPPKYSDYVREEILKLILKHTGKKLVNVRLADALVDLVIQQARLKINERELTLTIELEQKNTNPEMVKTISNVFTIATYQLLQV